MYELRDVRRFLQVGSVATSPLLEGTFGAADGREGRADPLRATLPELAARRHVPHRSLSIEYMRVGPMLWHTTVPYDPHHSDRASECDADGRPDGREARAFIAAALDRLRREPTRLTSYTQPPNGLGSL